jgi:hypothetical protein
MDMFENAIMHYVAADHSTLVIPEYDIGPGWSLSIFSASTPKSRSFT